MLFCSDLVPILLFPDFREKSGPRKWHSGTQTLSMREDGFTYRRHPYMFAILILFKYWVFSNIEKGASGVYIKEEDNLGMYALTHAWLILYYHRDFIPLHGRMSICIEKLLILIKTCTFLWNVVGCRVGGWVGSQLEFTAVFWIVYRPISPFANMVKIIFILQSIKLQNLFPPAKIKITNVLN